LELQGISLLTHRLSPAQADLIGAELMQKNLAIAFLTVALTPAAGLGFGPTVYNVPPDPLPTSLAAGEILNFYDGGFVPEFYETAPGSVVNVHSGFFAFFPYINGDLNVYGGTTGTTMFATGGTLNVFGGKLGDQTSLINGELNVYGGEVEFSLNAYDSVVNVQAGQVGFAENLTRSVLNISGGEVYGFANSPSQSTINLSGGTLGDTRLGGESILNMNGGTFPPNAYVVAYPDSQVNLKVRAASLNGQPIAGLAYGVTAPIDFTNLVGELTGVLEDGSPFEFSLILDAGPDGPGAVIVTDPTRPSAGGSPAGSVVVNITLVPEPSLTWTVLLAMASFGMQRRRTKIPRGGL
jgi:hypothetical protein